METVRERLWRLSGDFPGPQSAAAVTALLPRRVRFIDEYRSGTGPQGLGPAISQPGHTARVANEAKHTINHWADCWVLQLEAGKHHWQKGGGLGVWCGETQVVLPVETRVGHNRGSKQVWQTEISCLGSRIEAGVFLMHAESQFIDGGNQWAEHIYLSAKLPVQYNRNLYILPPIPFSFILLLLNISNTWG